MAAYSNCLKCGQHLDAQAAFCPNCGTAVPPAPPIRTPRTPAQPKKSGNTMWYIIVALLASFVLTLVSIIAYHHFEAQPEARLSDTVFVVTDTVYQTVAPATPATQTAPRTATPRFTLSHGGDFTYTGTIAGQRVKMSLTNQGGSVFGSYRYTKYTRNDHLALTGTLSGTALTLYEVDEYGQYSACIEATVTATGINGTHTRLDTGKRNSVKLTQD